MRRNLARLLLLALWFAGVFVNQGRADSHAGDLDPTFGVGGKVLTDFGAGASALGASAVAIQPDGKIVVVGTSAIVFGYNDFLVVRIVFGPFCLDQACCVAARGGFYCGAGNGGLLNWSLKREGRLPRRSRIRTAS